MIKKLSLLAVLAMTAIAAKAYSDTMGGPVIQRLTIESADLPLSSRPVTIAFISDIHVAGPDMSPRRLEHIVEQINDLEPDLVAIAGDLVSEKLVSTWTYTPAEIVAPLGMLEAPLGTVVVPGNHDHWFDWPGLRRELVSYPDVTVLENTARQIGPLAVGGLDDDFTENADLRATMAQLRDLEGPQILLTHSPDVFPSVPVSADLVLAGHTHCGQIGYPWGGSPKTMSEFGDLYSCGVVRENEKTLVTSAGLGTSVIPVRLFTQPEIWLIEIRPRQNR